MRVGEVEPAARAQEAGDHRGPAVEVGQPAERAPGDKGEIETPGLADRVRRVVEVAFDEAGALLQPELGRESARGGDGGRREVDPDHRRAALRERERVGAEVALEVDDPLAGKRPAALASSVSTRAPSQPAPPRSRVRS